MVKSELSGKRLSDVRGLIGELYGHDLHAKRIDALAGVTLGVMTGGAGQGFAGAAGGMPAEGLRLRWQPSARRWRRRAAW